MKATNVTRVGLLLAIVGMLLATFGCEREKDRLDAQALNLCQQDGGVRVYEAVKLPADRFDKFGGVSIPNKDKLRPEDDYFYEWDVKYLKTGNPELIRSQHRVIRRKDGKVLGESVRYIRRGGDLLGPWHESSFSCPEVGEQRGLERNVFQKE
jgi:hypothetical protein